MERKKREVELGNQKELDEKKKKIDEAHKDRDKEINMDDLVDELFKPIFPGDKDDREMSQGRSAFGVIIHF